MDQDTFVVSLPRGCVGKSSSLLTLFEKSHASLEWCTPDPRVSPMNMMTSNLVLDPIHKLRKHYPELMWTTESLIVPTNNPAGVYEHYVPYGHSEIPLDVQHASQFSGELRPTLKPKVVQILEGIVEYAKVSIVVTTNFILHIYGSKSALEYAQYKLFVVLNHLYGYAILRKELSLTMHPLVSGPDRQNLLTIFQQTGINVYMPPLIAFDDDVSVNEVYLAGDKIQLVLAEKLLMEVVVHRTDTLEKDCVISTFVRDVLAVNCKTEVEQIMLRHATYIQLPPVGSDSCTVRVMGTTRRSIENTIDELMKLCGNVYQLEFKAHLDKTLSAQICAAGANIMSSSGGTIIFGLNSSIKQTLTILKNIESGGISTSVLLEQPVELMDFILGKKQGKILKVVHGTNTTITVEKFHEHNFRLRLAGDKPTLVLDALKLLEEELPAEKSLFIPEVYHKQIIGQGGLSIQTLMRKYNVYMRFANTTKDKYPNAFGDTRSNNVIIRCPYKNRSQIDSAAEELLGYVDELAAKHCHRYVRLTRNQRRMLLASQSNGLREIEVSSGAAVKLPAEEAKGTQLVEISGQTEATTEMALTMISQLLSQTDYEFRVPWSARFAEAFGPRSDFYVRVSAPLFLAMGAQVQAFEKVQLLGDPSIYSQIVVSVNENIEGESFEDVSEVITAYLRKHNLDIIDKGKLSTELHVESDVADADINAFSVTTNSSTANPLHTAPSTLSANTTSTTGPFKMLLPTSRQPQELRTKPTSSLLYHSPTQQHEAQVALDFLKSKSQPQMAQPSFGVSSSFVRRSGENSPSVVPRETPSGLPSRPPMSAVQWNRNFDETPVKKRGLDSQQSEWPGSQRNRMSTPKVRLSRYHRNV